MPIKFCQHCNIKFFSKRTETKFCSRACYEILHSKVRDNIQCLECSKELKGEQKKFCSQSCAAKYNNRIRSVESRIAQKCAIRKTLTTTGRIRTDQKTVYRNNCSFKFNIHKYKNLPGYELLISNGIYHPIDNPSGVCRDHILSVHEGYKLGINPEILSHPANCQFLTNSDNCKKGTGSWIAVEELYEKIDKWNQQN
jgi:hypothetical protein